MDADRIVIIVEGKNDRSRLRRIVKEDIDIICTYGTPGPERLEQLKTQVGERQVYIFTDNDPSGKKIRARLCDAFPDAEQLYTKKGYAGVEGTPDEYVIRQLEKAGLEEYILYPDQTLPGSGETFPGITPVPAPAQPAFHRPQNGKTGEKMK